ncbi:MAG TPA: glycosyltransferase family 2 protein [Acidimicrobiales bacterium]|nr:glycosyltransferase family 2 protein [Acidimicrobiales bacterium]
MGRRDRTVYVALVTIGLVLTAAFAAVWFRPSNLPHNFHGLGHVDDIVLFGVVTFVVWHQIVMQLLLWLTADTMRRPAPMEPGSPYSVAFITTFVPGSEGCELLHRALPAMVDADYPHDTWLLDEGHSPEARRICRTYGVRYFTRHGVTYYNTAGGRFPHRTKGGNHNAWYDAYGCTYDIVAQIDTDFICRRDFLTKTIGYFDDPDVAFVGTPQVYGNTRDSNVARGAAQQLYGFYGPIMQGMSGIDSALMIGANHVVRTAALREIGLYAGHLTEDLLTGMTLHAHQWKSVYVPEILAVGEGPATWADYFAQQMRWAHGCMDILFRHSPHLLPQMTNRRRFRYLLLQQHYFSGLALGLGVVLLMVYFVTGFAATTLPIVQLLAFFLPLVVWQVVIAGWLQRFNVDPARERGFLLFGKIASIAAAPIYLMALLGVLRGRHLVFRVTPKGRVESKHRDPPGLFRPHIVLGSLTAVGIVVGTARHHHAAILVFWAALNTLVMWSIVIMAKLGRQAPPASGEPEPEPEALAPMVGRL